MNLVQMSRSLRLFLSIVRSFHSHHRYQAAVGEALLPLSLWAFSDLWIPLAFSSLTR